MFGADRDGGHTARARADLAACLSRSSVLYLPCDAGAEESEACTRAGIRMTPTLIAGGERVPGAPLQEIVALTEAPKAVARKLALRGAELFGRDSCVWTRRQKAVLGREGLEKVAYVDCEDGGKGQKRCAALGVEAVPTWGLDAGSVLLPGYRPLAQLELMSNTSREQLLAEAASQRGSGGGGGGVCR